MSTGEVFLSVTTDTPDGQARRMLSPLLEDEDEPEVNTISRVEFDVNYDDDQLFLTESKHSDYIATHKLGPSSAGKSSGVVDTSDGDIEDDIYTDDASSVESDDDDYNTDLDVDEEHWLHPERFERDLTGKAKYIKVCEDMGISPTTYFIKHIQDRELKMKFHGLGPQRMKALAIPLEINTNIEILNLEGNAIDSEGAICLTKVLKENFFITELVLADNKLGTEGGRAIIEILLNNRNIHKLDLTANEIGDGAAPCVCEVLAKNKLLKTLLLGNNCFEDEGARLLKAAISDNTTLEVLDLSWNHFKTRGATLLAEALQENVGLKSINIAMAGLGRDGAENIATALSENRTLQELDISLNRINLKGANAIASGLRENDSLKVLKCGSNPFDSDGAYEILEAVYSNDVSQLTLLDFSNIMVKINFAKLQIKLQEHRNIKVVSEGVIPEFTRTNSARLTAFRVDPIGAFKRYAENAGVDLGELLLEGLDEDYSIDTKEFKTLVKRSGIDVSEEQIGVIARRMALDGRVYCRSLLDIADSDGDDDENGNSRGRTPTTDRSESTLNLKKRAVTPAGGTAT